MPPQYAGTTTQAPQGFVETKLPDGTPFYVPDDKTDDQVKRQVKALPDYSPGPESKASKWMWEPKISQEQAAKFWANTLFAAETAMVHPPKEAAGPPSRAEKITTDVLGGSLPRFLPPVASL